MVCAVLLATSWPVSDGIEYMNQPTSSPRPVSPVWQFICLLAPVVMTGFYLVYALVGLVIDGSDKLKWSDEALQVGILATMIILSLIHI